ncbi:hypothetical protein JQS43_01145 [Natronosporangium hydrolyticum]|uniref:DUF1023 domain-containing protein n=1 Tax=Natronosporangium hydrolyticum TaxID=2811111 RepID=A0A895YG09_9ACTN|nr:alpha/beta hydrolase [Natronosporangium hydrolyticum]QSB15025.1 hypothetical protein JQS43_01145 [Natronosporangium hydrolyticum]
MWRLLRRTSAATLTVTLLAGLVGPVAPAVAYPAPPPFPAVTGENLPARYVATGTAVGEALAVAEAAGDADRAATLTGLAGWDLLEFDARGDGRAVAVVGDLAAAERIAVLVPGAHTTLDSFAAGSGPGGGAQALAAQARQLAPETPVAVVAWLGYGPPQGLSPDVLTAQLAHDAVPGLRRTMDLLDQVNQEAPVSLLCHSYGSVLCAAAVPALAEAELAVAELVLYGSPGVGADSVAELGTSARVWAGRSDRDWIRFVPSVRLAGVGFGRDPVSPEFGADRFDGGGASHGDYHRPGGVALHSLALIVLGRGEPVVADA